MDASILARAQFAANMSFDILSRTIGFALGRTLLFMRWRWLSTKDAAWLEPCLSWTKVFEPTFTLDVVSGLTTSFQSGTNRPAWMERMGEAAGP